jgi:rubrerythrin
MPVLTLSQQIANERADGVVNIEKAAARFEALANEESQHLWAIGELTLDESRTLARKACEIWLQSAVESLESGIARAGQKNNGTKETT